MPYAVRRRRIRKMRPMRRRRNAPAKTLAVKALRAVRQLRSHQEVKFIETEAIGQDIAATYPFPNQNLGPVGNGGAVFCVSAMAQGPGEGQRIGEKISPTSLSYSYQIGLRESATEAFVLRTIIFMDKQQVNAPVTVPGVGLILEDPRPQSMFNREVQPRFKILHDRTIVVNKESSTQRVTRLQRGYVRFPRSLQTYFTGTTNTSLLRNHIYMLQIATQYDGTNPSATVPLGGAYITMQVRFNYKDC